MPRWFLCPNKYGSLRNSFNACHVSPAAVGEKTWFFFPAKKAQDVRRAMVNRTTVLYTKYVRTKNYFPPD